MSDFRQFQGEKMISRDEVLTSLKHLPPLSDNLIKILNLIKSDKATGLKLGTIISYDTYLSSEILKYCNSAAYGFNSQIKSISHAVMLLGFNKVSSISSMLFMKKQFEIKENSPYYKIWEHSIGLAHGAEFLNSKINNTNDYFAFTAGLLTDVGKNAFLKSIEKLNPEFLADYIENCIENIYASDCIEYEKDVFGFDHMEIGFSLAFEWNLPDEIQNAIKMHHDITLAKENSLIKSLYISDMLMSKLNSDIEPEFLEMIGEDFEISITLLEETISTMKIALEMIREN